MLIKATFGSNNSQDIDVPPGTTVGQLKRMDRVRVGLSLPANVEAHIGGVSQQDSTQLAGGMRVDFHDAPCSKAVTA